MFRTVFDLAGELSASRLERLLNEVEVHGLTDTLSIPDLLQRYPGRRGSARLRALFEAEVQVRGISHSKLEERFLSFLAGTDLPQPRLNADIAVRGRFFKADALWGPQRLIVELDGRASHQTARAFERDRERDRLLMTAGWRVVRITWRQLHDDPASVSADLRRLLRRQASAPTL